MEEKVGDGVTAYAPGLDVQPGKAYGDGKQREDGEEVSYLYFEIFIQNDQMVLIGWFSNLGEEYKLARRLAVSLLR